MISSAAYQAGGGDLQAGLHLLARRYGDWEGVLAAWRGGELVVQFNMRPQPDIEAEGHVQMVEDSLDEYFAGQRSEFGRQDTALLLPVGKPTDTTTQVKRSRGRVPPPQAAAAGTGAAWCRQVQAGAQCQQVCRLRMCRRSHTSGVQRTADPACFCMSMPAPPQHPPPSTPCVTQAAFEVLYGTEVACLLIPRSVAALKEQAEEVLKVRPQFSY